MNKDILYTLLFKECLSKIYGKILSKKNKKIDA